MLVHWPYAALSKYQKVPNRISPDKKYAYARYVSTVLPHGVYIMRWTNPKRYIASNNVHSHSSFTGMICDDFKHNHLSY
jgi:hypothetical protein